MLNISTDTDDLIEIFNGKLSIKFYKNGPSQGSYEVTFFEKDKPISILKDCYCNIQFHNDHNEDLDELKSTVTSYYSNSEFISNELGETIKVLLIPNQEMNLNVLFKIQFIVPENQDFFLVKLKEIKSMAKIHKRVHSISPFTIRDSGFWLNGLQKDTNLEKITWFKNGFQSWSPCYIFFGTEMDTMGPSTEVLKLTFDNQDYHIMGRFYSEYNTVITDLTSKNSLVIGFVTNKDQFTRIIMDYESKEKLKLLTAFGCMDGVKLNETSISSSEELFIGMKTLNQGYYGLIDYSKVVKHRIEKSSVTEIPVGWCSWYYYYTNVTEADMVANMGFFRNNNEISVDFIQLDDGYFTKIGDYFDIDHQKFPNGLEFLFSQIKKNGFKTGIWTAPFFAVKTSKILKKHRDWFLTKDNKLLKVHFNWNSFQYALDLTKDEVLNYISELYKKLYQINSEYKMDFFKIDFLHAAVPYDADYTLKNLTRAQLLYQGVKKIRQSITNDSFLLGCGAPLGPCIGLVDAMRISEDTAPIWDSGLTEKYSNNKGIENPALKCALINILYRSYMHKYFWINDPDCLMIRRENTKLTHDEIRLQMTIFGLSGGQILLSDDMTVLSKEEINDARLLIPPYNPEEFDPILVDAFTNPIPTVYMLETNEAVGHRFLVAIINWNNDTETKTIKISELLANKIDLDKNFYIFNFWDKKFMGKYRLDEELELKSIAPHSCVYLSVIPVKKKAESEVKFISSDFHISQGCSDITMFNYDNSNKIQSKILKNGNSDGYIYVKIPNHKEIVEYENTYVRINDEENIWKFRVKFENEKLIEIILS